MNKYVNRNKSGLNTTLYIGLTDIGRVSELNENLRLVQNIHPKTWEKFVEDVNNSVYLDKGLLVYRGLDNLESDVAFLPTYDRYCDGDTMIYIFKLLKKQLSGQRIQYKEIIVLGTEKLKPEFTRRLTTSFPLVFNTYEIET